MNYYKTCDDLSKIPSMQSLGFWRKTINCLVLRYETYLPIQLLDQDEIL